MIALIIIITVRTDDEYGLINQNVFENNQINSIL